MAKRIHYMDALNVLSCFAVVVLHCTLHVFGASRDSYWKAALVLQGIFIFAVPIFFMLSGSHLIDYRLKYSTITFFKRRLKKVGVGLLLASGLCYITYSAFPNSFYAADNFATNFGLRDFVLRFSTNTINDTYWFLYAIVYLYMLTPLIALAKERKKLLEGYLVISFIIAFVLPTLVYLQVMDSTVFTSLFNWPFFMSTSTFYYVAGYYFSRWPIRKTSQVILISLVGLMALITMGFLGYRLNISAETYDSFMISVDSVFCAIYSVSIFVVFQTFEDKLSALSDKFLRSLSVIASVTFFIYLFHVPFINWLGINLHSEWLIGLFYKYPLTKAVFVFVVVGGIALVWNGVKLRVSTLFKTH